MLTLLDLTGRARCYARFCDLWRGATADLLLCLRRKVVYNYYVIVLRNGYRLRLRLGFGLDFGL
jgi:hypothetical protein